MNDSVTGDNKEIPKERSRTESSSTQLVADGGGPAPDKEARMADVVDALKETETAIDNVALGDISPRAAEELYGFRGEIEEWLGTFRTEEEHAREDAGGGAA